MADIDFGGVVEEVITSEEFSLEKAREVLKDETVVVLGYGVQGPGQALNMRDNGIRVIVGQREGGASWDHAVADGFIPGETLFPLEEAAKKGTIIQFLLSDAGQTETWPEIKKCLNEGDALYFSHGFSIKTRPILCRRIMLMLFWLLQKVQAVQYEPTFWPAAVSILVLPYIRIIRAKQKKGLLLLEL